MEFTVKTYKEFSEGKEEYYTITVRRPIPWEQIYREMNWDPNWVLIAEDTQRACTITHDPWDRRDCFRWRCTDCTEMTERRGSLCEYCWSTAGDCEE